MKRFITIVLLLLATSIARASDPAMVIHLLNYLAKDYGGAVQNGKIVSQSEYQEQVEFAEIIEKETAQIPTLNSDSQFKDGIKNLIRVIKSKGDPKDVEKIARSLQASAIQLSKFKVAPTKFPDLSHGEKLYQTNCVACHGMRGQGDGPAGVALDPKPANFTDPETMKISSPFQYFTTVRLGVPGTGMAAFSTLTDEDVWALAFYIKTLGFQAVEKTQNGLISNLDLAQLATKTDQEIFDSLQGSDEEKNTTLAILRTKSSDGGGHDDFLSVARKNLTDSFNEAEKGNFKEASTLSVRAYLQGIEPLEPKIKANEPHLVAKIETEFSQYRNLLDKSNSVEVISVAYKSILNTIDEIATVVTEHKMSPSLAFTAAFSIFLREGFEAVLIIIVLIGILKAMGATQALKWVHVGWSSALAVGILAWFASDSLMTMSGASRELMEGAISLFAVVVLLYVGFWLHRHSQISKWKEFLEAQVKRAQENKTYSAIAGISFIAVFREAFEVVLFLRAIWLDLDSSGQTVAGFGVLTSFGVIMAFSYLAVKTSQKLPLKQLFTFCSITMVALAVILAGKGVHSLQEAGYLSALPLSFGMRSELIGLYPTLQGVLSQITLAAGISIFLLYEKLMPAMSKVRSRDN